MIIVKKNESDATLRRMFFQIVDAVDGMTPELGEAGGQSQISVGGGAWANTTNTLVAIGNGRYYVELTQAEVNIADRSIIEGRYKSANTTETIGSTIQVLEFVPDASIASTAKEATVAGILGDLTPGVLQSLVTVTKNSIIKRGDVVSMTFLLGSEWNITGKKVYYMAKINKEDANNEAIFEKICTFVNATTATCNLTITDTATAGEYYHEIEVRDADGTSNPRTAIEGTLEITEDVRK